MSRFWADLALLSIVILVGICSFLLGRFSTISTATHRYIPAEQTAAVGESGATSAYVIASKKGTKYHYPWCSGAQRIKESNRIEFTSTEAAVQAGYAPAGNCKGLE